MAENSNVTPACHHKIFFAILIILAIAIGNTLAGWFIGHGINTFRSTDRYVSVKGIAEQKVKADFAIWDVSYKITGDNLQQLGLEVTQNQKSVEEFLLKSGFAATEIEPQRTEVIDQYARDYSSSTKPAQRYIATGTVIVRTDKVDLLQQVSQASVVLMQQGIATMNKNDYAPNPRYFYTKLDEVRPALLQQATKSARLVAQQFAADSGSHLGTIRHASQGQFQILSVNSNGGQNYGSDNEQVTSIYKLVRVVSSIDYELN